MPRQEGVRACADIFLPRHVVWARLQPDSTPPSDPTGSLPLGVCEARPSEAKLCRLTVASFTDPSSHPCGMGGGAPIAPPPTLQRQPYAMKALQYLLQATRRHENVSALAAMDEKITKLEALAISLELAFDTSTKCMPFLGSGQQCSRARVSS